MLNTLGQRQLNATENRFLFQDKESFLTFGLNGLHDFGPRFLDKTIGGIWSQPDIMAENYAYISPYNYVFSNPLSFIDPSGMTPDQASDGYSNIDTRNTSGSISFFSFGGQGMSTEDPAKRIKITQNPGSMESIPDQIYNFARGFSNGLGQLLHDIAPIKIADENDPKTISEAIRNIKNIPSNLAKMPSQLTNIYRNGNLEQKTQATVQTIGIVLAMVKGKSLSLSGVMKAGFSIPKGFKLIKKFGFSNGQKVYEFGGKYYSKDIGSGNGLGSHNGGVWKVFEVKNGRLNRIGTVDNNLNIFKK